MSTGRDNLSRTWAIISIIEAISLSFLPWVNRSKARVIEREGDDAAKRQQATRRSSGGQPSS